MTTLHIQLIGAFMDMSVATLTGIIRALGFQATAVKIMLFGNYVLSLPVIYWFAFHKGYGYKGLWASTLTGITFNFSAFVGLLYFADWNKAVEAFKIRK